MVTMEMKLVRKISDGQRVLEVHFLGVAIFRLRNGFVEEIGDAAGQEHHQAHREDPDEELGLDVGRAGEEDKGDECDAGDAIGFETVGGGAAAIAGVVAGAVGDDAGVAGVVFLDVEDDLHQVGADVGDFREDSARHAQGRGAKRFTDGKPDESTARPVPWARTAE